MKRTLGKRTRAVVAGMVLGFLGGLVSCGGKESTSPGGGRDPELVAVQPGTFQMGSPALEPGRAGNEALHPVTLTRPFLISSTEVTQAQWQDVMGWNESGWISRSLPAENLTWFDAIEFCNRLSANEGRSPAYLISNSTLQGGHIISATVTWSQDSDGYRLPTEAEWEYCCRAGRDTTYAFPEGPATSDQAGCQDEPGLTPVAWYCRNSGMKTHPGGQKDPNGWGIYDMNGNVWEWCWDRGDTTYARSVPVIDPTGALSTATTKRALRGGSWGTTTLGTRCAIRNFLPPESHFNYIGFRLARSSS